jgi:DNA-directed RNA polymerase beta' subunit
LHLIVKFNNELKNSSSETRTEELLTLISNTIHHMMDNSKGKAKDQGGQRPIKCLKQRLEGKYGHVRANLSKRVDFCGRTVITGEANCDVDELIVPKMFAEKVTVPVNVNAINIRKCQEMLENDEVLHIIRGKRRIPVKTALLTKATLFKQCDKVLRDDKVYMYHEVQELIKSKRWIFKPTDQILRQNGKMEQYVVSEKIPFKLMIGDVVERKIRDGDVAIFNRQPTLWKGSMQSKQVKILPGKTVRMNLATTEAFNADHDGDKQTVISITL